MRELIVDSFCGGGGASVGIEQAIGRGPDIAINHDEVALAMHAINHPGTRHLPHNIWKVDPLEATKGRPVGLLWASPDCKHFSKAKGGRPVKQNIRDLAWVVVRWAKQVAPRIIVLENVEEFVTWGPVGPNGMPCPQRKGQTFRRWINELRRLGYKVEWRELCAANYGSPTVRNRFFLIARRDGKPIVWPKATHGKPGTLPVQAGRAAPWRAAAEIIDWSLPCPSIFLTKKQARKLKETTGLDIRRPLAPNTMARIAKGVQRYVLRAAKPYIVSFYGEGNGGTNRTTSPEEPLRTVTCDPRHGLITPFIAPVTHPRDQRVHDIEEPIRTVTGSQRGDHAVVAPVLVNTRNGERQGQRARCRPVEAPHPTVTAVGSQGAVCAAFLAQQNTDMVGHPMTRPVSTIVQKGCTQSLVQVELRHDSDGLRACAGRTGDLAGSAGRDRVAVEAPESRGSDRSDRATEGGKPTSERLPHGDVRDRGQDEGGICASARVDGHQGADTARPGNQSRGRRSSAQSPIQPKSGDARGEPCARVPERAAQGDGKASSGPDAAVVSAGIVNLKGSERRGSGPDLPTPTQTAGGWHVAEVRAFLLKYYGTDQDPRLEEPLATATTKDRFSVCTVDIAGEPYQIVDIGMRMLSPRELFLAQGFPADFIIDRGISVETGEPVTITKTAQIRCCGNSVCPQVAAAIVAANYTDAVVEAPAETPLFALQAAE